MNAFEKAFEKAPADGGRGGGGVGEPDDPPYENKFMLIENGLYLLGFGLENWLILVINPFLLFKLIVLL